MPRCHPLLLPLLVLFLATAAPLRAAGGQSAIPTADSPTAGPATAPVTIVEFLDFT